MISPYVVPGLKSVLLTSLATNFKVEALKEVLLEYNLKRQPKRYTWKDVQGQSRKRELVLLRHMYCYLCMKYRLFSSQGAVGDTIGDRDHTTIIHSCQTIQDQIDTQNAATIDLLTYINNNL